jgi:ABC-type transport system involved in multi-copper enzyme maturation permease subunit
LSTIWTIARMTFREALRRRILNIILVFAVVSIGASRLFTWLSPGEELKFILDMCSNSIRFFSMLIAVVLGASMIPTEIERRTIFSILSKPVGRTQFVLGKYIGALLTLILNVAIMSVIYLVVLVAKKPSYALNATLWEGILLVIFEVGVLLAIAVAVSTVASTAFNVVFTFFVYFLGQMGGLFKDLASPERMTNVVGQKLMQAFYYALPHFESFDLRQPLLTGEPVPVLYLVKVIGTAIGYSGAVLLIAHLLFSQREF